MYRKRNGLGLAIPVTHSIASSLTGADTDCSITHMSMEERSPASKLIWIILSDELYQFLRHFREGFWWMLGSLTENTVKIIFSAKSIGHVGRWTKVRDLSSKIHWSKFSGRIPEISRRALKIPTMERWFCTRHFNKFLPNLSRASGPAGNSPSPHTWPPCSSVPRPPIDPHHHRWPRGWVTPPHPPSLPAVGDEEGARGGWGQSVGFLGKIKEGKAEPIGRRRSPMPRKTKEKPCAEADGVSTGNELAHIPTIMRLTSVPVSVLIHLMAA